MHAPVLYMVKAWVSPDGGERYLRWLEEKHMAEVIREPGFLWAQRCRLEQVPDEPGSQHVHSRRRANAPNGAPGVRTPYLGR